MGNPTFFPTPMKSTWLALLIAAAALLCTHCASYPGTTSLWVGMTREQALRAMGPAESVSAQGAFEYLNYTLPISNGGYVVSRPYVIRLVDGVVESYGYSGQFMAGSLPAAASSSGASGASATATATSTSSRAAVTPVTVAKNQLRILSVEPTRLTLGQPNRVKVKLGYALPQLPVGVISLSFNTKTPGMQLSLAKRTVTTGTGEVEIALDVTPIDWPQRSDVKMLASLFPSPEGGASSLDFVQWDFAVTR